MTIGELIKNRRKELHMSQEDVALAVGTTKATVSRWESGDIHKMKRPMISALARVLQLDPMVFMQREEILMPEEHEVVTAYRNADTGTRNAVRKLLDLGESKKDVGKSAI